MRKTILFTLLAFMAMPAVYSQIKIGDNPQNIDAASVLELESTDRVLVITRVDTAQMNAIVPNQGAMVYNTDTQCIHYFDGTQWVNLCNSAGLEFTTDPIVNTVSTIVITDQAGTKNFEIAPNSIGTEQIINGGINGVDIQNGSIGPGKLQNQSVTQDKLSENSVGAFALDNDNINLSDFNNDLNLLTISTEAGNDIVDNNGAYYDNQPLQDDIALNTTSIQNHIAADADTNAGNEIQTLSFNAGTSELTLTNPTGNNIIDLSGLSGTGTDNQNLTGATLNATNNELTITIEDGNPAVVDLSPLAGGGGTDGVVSNVVYTPADNNLTFTGSNGGFNGVINLDDLDGGGGGNQNLNEVLTQGNDAGANRITNLGAPTADQDAATKLYVDNAVTAGGGLNNGTILIGDAGDNPVAQTVGGDATLANDGTLTIADDAITLDKIATNGATTNGQILEWDNDNGEWIIAAGGGGTINEQSIALNDANDEIELLDDDGITVGSSVKLDGTTVEVFDNGTENVIQIADDGVTLDKIAPPDPSGTPAPANGQVMVWDNDNSEWVIDAQAGEHSGPGMSLFYADASTGLPTTAFNPNNGDENTAPSLIWDQSKRVGSGALGIGIDGGPFGDTAKVHISEDIPGGLALPLQIQNRIVNNNGDRGVGILFSTERQFAYGKGALVYERLQSFAKGDFHFLQDDDDDTTNPEFTDKAFTIKNNKDIRLYGGIDVDGTPTGLGANNQVLASGGPGNPLKWVNNGGLPDGTANNQVIKWNNTSSAWELGTDNSLVGTAAGSIFFSGIGPSFTPTENNAQLFWDNTDNKLYVGPQTVDSDTDVKLNIGGTSRTQGLKNSNGSADLPSYRFTNNLDTGMYLIDDSGVLGFSTNDTEAIRIDASQNVGIGTNNPSTKLHIFGNLRLEGGDIIARNGAATTVGHVLTNTANGTEWAPAGGLPSGGSNGQVLATDGVTPTPTYSWVNNDDDQNATEVNLSPAIDVDHDNNNENTVQEAIADLSSNKIIAKGIVPAASGASGAYTIPVTMPANSIIQVSPVQNTPGNPMIIQITGQTTADFSVQIFEFDILTMTYNQVNANWHYTIINP